MTRKPLNKGDILRNKTNEYEIYEVISFSGFSSLIYKGFEKPSDTSSYLKPVIIKEFFPKDLFFQGIITRETDGKTITGLDKYPEQIATFEKQATISNEMSWNSEDNSLSSYFLYTQVFRTNGTSYIIMDSSSGCTLKEYVHEQGLPSNKAELIEYIELTKRIIEAIEPIHKKNYLHLDIKPDNLYVTDLKQDEKFGSSTIRAIDFGSCLPMFETFDTNDFMLQLTESGSYSSPVLKDVNDECFISFMESPSNFDYSKLNEQFKRLSQADDVYSICVILNEMITGNKTYSAVDFDKIKYLNLAEIDFLKKIFEDEFINGTNMDSLEFFKNLLNEFIGVMKHTLITKHSLWSGVLEYYFRHKDSIIFKTEHESLLNPKYKVPKFNIMANFKDETIPALEVIKNFEEKHIYIIAGGGMGKSIIAAEKFLEYLSSGSKIPVYVDLNDINICEYKGTPEKKLQKLILNRIISTTIDDMLVKKFEDELKRPSINSSEYCLIFDNLHKVDANIYIEALNIMSNNYNNARIIILGRDFSMSEKLNEKFICIPLVGITDSEKEKYNIPFRKVFSVPLFSAIYLELHSIQESTLVNEGDLIWKYLSGVKGYGGNITITQEDADALYKVKNIILPKIAYEISSKHESINICNISKFLNNISIQQFDKLALKLLGLVELRDGEYSFKHDFFTDYFASFYIAQTINSYLKSASTTCLRNINNNWNFEANNYIYAIFTNEFNLPLDTVMELLYAKLNLDINAKKEAYEIPFNIVNLYYGVPDIKLFFYPSDLLGFFKEIVEFNFAEISKWIELGVLFGYSSSINQKGCLCLLMQKYNEAKNCFIEASLLESAQAEYILSILCMLENRTENALFWMERSAARGFPDAIRMCIEMWSVLNNKWSYSRKRYWEDRLLDVYGTSLEYESNVFISNDEAFEDTECAKSYYIMRKNILCDLGCYHSFSEYEELCKRKVSLTNIFAITTSFEIMPPLKFITESLRAGKQLFSRKAYKKSLELYNAINLITLRTSDINLYETNALKKSKIKKELLEAKCIYAKILYNYVSPITYSSEINLNDIIKKSDQSKNRYFAYNCLYFAAVEGSKEAYELLSIFSHETNDFICEILLADLYYYGYGTKIDFRKAAEIYSKHQVHNIYCAIKIGDMKYYAQLYEQNYYEAFQTYIKSWEISFRDWNFMYELFPSIKEKIRTILELLCVAETNSKIFFDNNTNFYLAECYYTGFNLKERNPQKSYELYSLINDSTEDFNEQFSRSKTLLRQSKMLMEGDGCIQNYLRSLAVFTKAVDLCEGNNFNDKLNSLLNANKDYVEYLQLLFENLYKQRYSDDGDNLFALGFLYEYGIYVNKSPSEARKYYLIAAQANNRHAQYRLGKMYASNREFSKSIILYEASAEQDYLDAQFDLACMYQFELKDYEKAKIWYERLLSNNHLPKVFLAVANNNLGVINKQEQYFEKALKHYLLALHNGCGRAAYNLGYLYQNGLGVEQNYDAAIKCYTLAVEMDDDADAKKALELLRSE